MLRRSDEPQKMKKKEKTLSKETTTAAARLAQLVKRRSPKRNVARGSNPGRTNTQGLKITEENVLP